MIYFFIAIILFLYGAVVGSFINVIASRYTRGESFIKGRSHCDDCSHTLAWVDLIPILSFIFLKRRCRYCKTKLSYRYVLVEILTGILLMTLVYVIGFNLLTFMYFSLGCLLVIITLIDLETMTIPDGFILSILPLVLFSLVINPELLFIERITGIFIVSLPMYILNIFIEDSFGGGDIKLMAATGLLLGWKLNLLGFFIAIFIGGSYGIYLLLSKKAEKGMHIPFGPCLGLGITYSMLFGIQTINWYLNFFVL